MNLWPRKRKPDPVAEAVEEQRALGRSTLSRVDRVLRSAAEILPDPESNGAIVADYEAADRERRGRTK